LYGLLIVDDAANSQIDREVLLVLDDWSIRSDGSWVGSPSPEAKEHVTVNGLPSIDVPVRTNERIRFRILNASVARAFTVRIDQHRPIVMAIDGQPSEPFPARDSRVTLAPGNRVDLFADAVLAADTSASILIGNGVEEKPIARLVYEQGSPVRSTVRNAPSPLPASGLPAKLDLARAQRVELPVDATAKEASARQALFTVKRGRAVVLALPNRTTAVYSMHLHGHHFRLLDALDDGWKPFWLDTVMVSPSQTTRIAFVADNPGKWPVRCTRLGDGAAGADRWFEVT
jgi:FtsP/CotA-like multicopper oxidase with cupredoxin domain